MFDAQEQAIDTQTAHIKAHKAGIDAHTQTIDIRKLAAKGMERSGRESMTMIEP